MIYIVKWAHRHNETHSPEPIVPMFSSCYMFAITRGVDIIRFINSQRGVNYQIYISMLKQWPYFSVVTLVDALYAYIRSSLVRPVPTAPSLLVINLHKVLFDQRIICHFAIIYVESISSSVYTQVPEYAHAFDYI